MLTGLLPHLLCGSLAHWQAGVPVYLVLLPWHPLFGAYHVPACPCHLPQLTRVRVGVLYVGQNAAAWQLLTSSLWQDLRRFLR
jgi:hypothetical protein